MQMKRTDNRLALSKRTCFGLHLHTKLTLPPGVLHTTCFGIPRGEGEVSLEICRVDADGAFEMTKSEICLPFLQEHSTEHDLSDC